MQGSLSEFRLAEILQLVAVQQKTGLLRLTQGKQLVTFYFDSGVLVSTRDRRHVTYDPLLEYLTRVGWLQPEMAALLRRKMEGSREDAADLILGERFMTLEELGGALEDLAQEMVHQTFTWRQGTYQFVGGDEALVGLRYKLGLKIDGILMEAARRADESPRLREKLGDSDTILDLALAPSTDLGPRAYGVLSQIEGVMRLGDVLRRARVPEFEVYEILAQAVDAGTVRILERSAPPPEPTAPAPRPVARPVRAPRSTLWTLPRPLGWTLALGLSVFCALAAWLGSPHLNDRDLAARTAALETAKARAALRGRIEVYRALHGRYPASLGEVLAADLASPRLVHDAAPLHYAVAPDGASFVLGPPGGTADRAAH